MLFLNHSLGAPCVKRQVDVGSGANIIISWLYWSTLGQNVFETHGFDIQWWRHRHTNHKNPSKHYSPAQLGFKPATLWPGAFGPLQRQKRPPSPASGTGGYLKVSYRGCVWWWSWGCSASRGPGGSQSCGPGPARLCPRHWQSESPVWKHRAEDFHRRSLPAITAGRQFITLFLPPEIAWL